MERPGAQELEGRFEFSWIKRNTEAILGKKRNERWKKRNTVLIRNCQKNSLERFECTCILDW